MRALKFAVCAFALAPVAAFSNAARPVQAFAVLTQAKAAIDAGRPEKVLALLRHVKAEALEPKLRGTFFLQRAVAYAMLKRIEETKTSLLDARRAVPNDVGPLVAQLLLARTLGDRGLAVEAVDVMISSFPNDAQRIDPEQIWPLVRGLRKNGDAATADQLTVRLASIGFGGNNFVDRDSMTIAAIDALLKQADIDGARTLANNVVDRKYLTALLTRRKYAALWPGIESRIDDGMRLPLVQAIYSAENWLQREPGLLAARQTLITAYQNSGRLADAAKIAGDFAKTAAELSVIDEAGGWLINDHAFTLLALDKPEASDARFAMLAQLDIAKSPWLISMLINRGELLARTGRYAAAAALFPVLEAQVEQYGSPYAVQLVRRMKACAAFKQGKPEAGTLIAEMVAHTADARGATVEGLVCSGKRDAAAALAIAALADEKDADGMIDTLLPPLPLGDPSSWGATVLMTDPNVRLAVEKLVRPLPERFVVREPVN